MNTIISVLLGSGLMSLFSLISCSKNEPSNKMDDVLSITRTPYNGNQLKINGYYYQKYNSQYYNIHFFCSNGILIDFSGGNMNSFEQIENYLNDPETLIRIKNTKYSWGVFLVNGNNLKMEQWHPSSGGPLPAYVRSGSILNDTTFQITEMYRMQNGKKTDISTINEIYYYKAFSPKPDSTNKFVP